MVRPEDLYNPFVPEPVPGREHFVGSVQFEAKWIRLINLITYPPPANNIRG